MITSDESIPDGVYGNFAIVCKLEKKGGTITMVPIANLHLRDGGKYLHLISEQNVQGVPK